MLGPASPSVLLITVDTLRADHLGLYGYRRDTSPQIDRFFANATIYERAYTTHSATSASVASLLSGLLPQEHRVRLYYQLLPAEVAIIPDALPSEYQRPTPAPVRPWRAPIAGKRRPAFCRLRLRNGRAVCRTRRGGIFA